MKKHIVVIAAVSENGVYGEGNEIPWHLPEDFKHFKEKTTGHTVIMGRKTWESLPLKFRPLPNRHNVVVTTTSNYVASGATISPSIEQAIIGAPTEKVFCIGGASIWYHAMSIADEAFISVVEGDYPVTPDTTHCAKDLLMITTKWLNLKLDSVTRFQDFHIEHWKKRKK